MNRRSFLGTTAGTGSAAWALETQSDGAAVKAAQPEVTRILAEYVVSARLSHVPDAVKKEATRTMLNWVGCAIGGSRQPAVENALAALTPFAGAGQCSLLGRGEKLDALNASLINGIGSHVLDYDDTHLKTVIHPAGPVASAILAYAEYRPVTGQDFLNALVLGIEVECRIGNAVYPTHYDRGWHITGTTGPFGAAAAVGKLLGLSVLQMEWALGLAAVQPVGLREMFGSMTKSFHPGRAAQNGFTAALLASRNFTSSEHGIEAKSGWVNVLSTAHNYDEITRNLGRTYEVSLNTYKPFACGIVTHPTIDGCIQLRNESHVRPADIARVDLSVHPLVLELTGKKAPRTGLEGKFSIYHAAAVAIVEGAAGEAQFSDRAVNAADTSALRERVFVVVDKSLHEDQARIRFTLRDGKVIDRYIEHAVGSVAHPMSDGQLERKFRGLAEGILPAGQVADAIRLCWGLEALPDVATLARTASLAS